MFFEILARVFWGAFLTEALTELVVKSELFGPLRKFCKDLPFLGKVLNCGYCFSFWAAGLLVLLGLGSGLGLASPRVLEFAILVLLFQRASNILHNCIDKFTDKYYSLAHTNSDKGE